jgi:hypothetical protein
MPRFEGYLTGNGEIQFALTSWHDGAVGGHALLRLGQSFSGYRLERFDPNTEILTIKDGNGVEHNLTPPQAKITNEAASRNEPKAKAIQEIEDYRKAAIRRFGSANVVVDLDGSLIPESRRKNYEAYRAQAEQKGMLFFPVSVDGKWYNTFVPIDGKRPDPKSLESLSPQDAEEIRLRWKIAQAEAGARVLAGPPLHPEMRIGPKTNSAPERAVDARGDGAAANQGTRRPH